MVAERMYVKQVKCPAPSCSGGIEIKVSKNGKPNGFCKVCGCQIQARWGGEVWEIASAAEEPKPKPATKPVEASTSKNEPAGKPKGDSPLDF